MAQCRGVQGSHAPPDERALRPRQTRQPRDLGDLECLACRRVESEQTQNLPRHLRYEIANHCS